MAIINEFATRWDNDGVMLDFERDPMYFWPPQGGGAKPENTKKMTDLIRSVRATLDKVQAQRGKKQLLMVRGVANIQTCQERGLDIPAWVKEGLVQVIIPGAGYAPFTLDLQPWLELVEGKECWIYPSNNHWKHTDVTRAWALQDARRRSTRALSFQLGPSDFRLPGGRISVGPRRFQLARECLFGLVR